MAYNSKEGEYIKKVLKNSDLSNLVESYLYNDVWVRITLPKNICQDTKANYNKNTIIEYEDFPGFYAFHEEKTVAQTEAITPEITQRVNACVQTLIKLMEAKGYTVLDYFMDYRFKGASLYLLYLKPTGNGVCKKLVFDETNILEKAPKVKELLNKAYEEREAQQVQQTQPVEQPAPERRSWFSF